MAGLPKPHSTASFWHSEPSEFLLGHRTTKDLPSEADVVIIGSGITGASAARFLQEDERAKGLRVVMLEAREACWGATGRNGGHCQPLLLNGTPDVVAFEVKNWETVQHYIQENNVPCEWAVRPACRTIWTTAMVKQMKDQYARLKEDAPELASRAEWVSDPAVLRTQHKANQPLTALIVQNAASLWPYKLIAYILEAAIRSDRLNLQTKTPVTHITPVESTESTQDGPRHIVHTSRGRISTRHAILATNGYTSHLLPDFRDLIVPERGTMSALLPPRNSTHLPHSYGFVSANGQAPDHDDYLIQRPFSGVPNPAGHLMFGGGKVAEKGSSMDTVDDSLLDEGSAQYLRRELLHLLVLDGETTGLTELQATHQWSGIWGVSRDRTPWVGKVPGKEGIWLAGGYSGHGMPNGTLCGKAVVEMLLGEESSAPQDYVEERLVRKGELPLSYLISEERIERCRKMGTVQEQEVEQWRGEEMKMPEHLRQMER